MKARRRKKPAAQKPRDFGPIVAGVIAICMVAGLVLVAIGH